MRKKKVGAIAIKSFALLVVLGTAYQAMAQDATTPYMLSKQGYGGDSVEHWPPHLMF